MQHRTAVSQNGMYWNISKDTQTTKISCSAENELAPLIHGCFSCAYIQLLLEVDLDCSIIYAV